MFGELLYRFARTIKLTLSGWNLNAMIVSGISARGATIADRGLGAFGHRRHGPL